MKKKPLILIGNRRLVGSAEEMAKITVDAKADAIERRSLKLRLRAETAKTFTERHDLLARALLMLGQAQGMRMARIVINAGKTDDKKKSIDFWRN
jgi:hypothetical protein